MTLGGKQLSDPHLGALLAMYAPPPAKVRLRGAAVLIAVGAGLLFVATYFDHTILVPILGVLAAGSILAGIDDFFQSLRDDPTVTLFENALKVRSRILLWSDLDNISFRPGSIHVSHGVTHYHDCEWTFVQNDGVRAIIRVRDGDYIDSPQLNLLLRRWCKHVPVVVKM